MIKFVKKMVELYGVPSCFDNIDKDNTLEDEGLWFECPECGEPIYISDWEDHDFHCCPVCEFDF